jgi:hypothetical protein
LLSGADSALLILGEKPMKLLCATVFTLAITTTSFADVFTVDDDGKADFDNIQAAVNDDPIQTEDCCDIECGTLETPEAIKQTQRMLANGTWDEGRMHPLNNRGTQYVRITAHVVRYSNGTGGLPQSRIDTAIEDLNNHVGSTGLVFFQDGDTLFIDSDQYADCDTSEMDALRQIDVVDGSVNIYFVPETSICGRSSFYGMGVQGIVMNNDCTATTTNHSTFTHELGHYFNLWHTHTTSLGGAECVDGSNCSTAGDLFCDTPADPNVSGLVSDSCVYYGTVLDACGSGALYNPSTENLMSYSKKWCRYTFTSEQLSMFLWSAENQRADHIVNSDPGACCIEQSGACIEIEEFQCLGGGGDWQGVGTYCADGECAFGCEGDTNGDGEVNVTDLLEVVDQWGNTSGSADINDDGIVDVSDLLVVIGVWGACP